MRYRTLQQTTFAILLSAVLFACTSPKESHSDSTPQQKIGVLLVNHGSHSPTWRKALTDLDSVVRGRIMEDGTIQDVKTAFMEYTEPSIATRMRQFDSAGYTDVIIVPIFLTVSSHSFDDIPTIIGQKEDPQSMETLKIENIERYQAKAKTHITPLLDFTNILQKNVLRRYKNLVPSDSNIGLALIAYGDAGYNTEWSALMDSVGQYVARNTNMTHYSYNWCGHIAHYNPDSTTIAINQVLEREEKSAVIPVLVAHDEMFQVKIIGNGINKVSNYEQRVLYKPDAILPDPNIEDWVVNIVEEFKANINTSESSVAHEEIN
ncbi:MAG: CbiX/SirB N-terminal domain-containing protein [Bacteroidia bacterium]|nr:CbiX/SirB N-terminal domain-containing protein [Bacteroidia bacterium]